MGETGGIGEKLSIQGIEFLYKWIQQHLEDSDRGGDSTRAMVLADKCREAAAVQGLPVDDEPEWANLESIIYLKMHPSKGEKQGHKGMARHAKK